MNVLIVLFVLFLAYLFYNFYYKRLAYPPGPIPLPLIGNIIPLGLSKRFEFKFIEWAEQFGPVYTYWMGETPIVSINDPKLAYQVFIKDGENYVNRGPLGNFQNMLDEKETAGVIFTEGPLWLDQRRFAIKFLRDFGLGKNQMQERILEEVQILFEKINSDIKSDVEEHDLFNYTDIAIGSIINNLVLGYSFTQNKEREKEFYRLKNLTIEMMNVFTNPFLMIVRFNPFIEKHSYKIMKRFYKPIQELFDFIDEQIKQRIKTEEIGENIEPQDLVDAFLIEKAKQKRLNLPTADLYTLKQLRGLVFDIWFAAQETTSTTLTWAIAYIICNPEVQLKIHEELDKEINGARIITVSDRPQLNYINAVIMEVQRCANIIAVNLQRHLANDVVVEGRRIPKGAYCLPQICVIQYDPKTFDEPTKFKPERFLDSNNQLIKNDALMPFSVGKRVCLGEGLAKMELFLFLANLCNQYEFLPGKVKPELCKYPSSGSTGTKPYKCRVHRRFD